MTYQREGETRLASQIAIGEIAEKIIESPEIALPIVDIEEAAQEGTMLFRTTPNLEFGGLFLSLIQG